jgi:predicted transcriptional regulator
MSQTIKIELPDNTINALEQAAGEEGMSESALIEKALTDYLFVRQFRNLRERMLSTSAGPTDQDVFDLVS